MRKFNEAFAPYGLPKTAIKPSYGMAEATLFVSTTHPSDEAKVMYVDRDELNAGRMVQVDQDAPGAVAQVACGAVSRSQWATIVDPETAAERPDGYVGEIWLPATTSGRVTGVASRRPPRRSTTSCSSACPRTRTPRARRTTRTGLRTGDYGVFVDGELYITGRVKDLVIVDGRNHYPQDLEYSAQEASSRCAPDSSPRSPARRTSCRPRCSRTRIPDWSSTRTTRPSSWSSSRSVRRVPQGRPAADR
ncbi:AMP-binding protein [Rhodococcus hoagii]|nr:AMP-binding protein [Prescottella equi]